MGSEQDRGRGRRAASPMSSWRGPTSSTRWTRRCSPRSATRSARSGAIRAVRAILLSGRGRHFTAGLDLDYAAKPVPGEPRIPARAAEARLRHIEWLQDAFSALEAARAPVIAAIHGGCIGAGVDLAAACDLRVASADAFFQVAEVDVAITADLGTLQRLGYLIPQGVLRELDLYRPADGRRGGGALRPRQPASRRTATAAIAAGHGAGADDRRQIAARGGGAKKSLNHSRGRTGRGGAARRRLVERRDSGQRRPRPKRSRRGSARPSRASARSRIRVPLSQPHRLLPPGHEHSEEGGLSASSCACRGSSIGSARRRGFRRGSGSRRSRRAKRARTRRRAGAWLFLCGSARCDARIAPPTVPPSERTGGAVRDRTACAFA